jgi:hypothetical protein
MARRVKVQAGMECSSGIFRSKRAQEHIMDAAVDFTFEAIKIFNELRELFMTDVYYRPKSRRAIRSSNIDLCQIFVGPDLF